MTVEKMISVTLVLFMVSLSKSIAKSEIKSPVFSCLVEIEVFLFKMNKHEAGSISEPTDQPEVCVDRAVKSADGGKPLVLLPQLVFLDRVQLTWCCCLFKGTSGLS